VVIRMKIPRSMSLSSARRSLREVVQSVRRNGDAVIMTVDGKPAARVEAVDTEPRRLTAAETATVRALMDAIVRIPRSTETFDAVAGMTNRRR
jgi:antitoxin (DNA-binding transcriptional repressor) of toxin-antitoxin stability system